MESIITTLYIIACVLLFSLAILVHEFGHFIVALKLGMRVEAFSIGFGPAIWKKKIRGIEYRICPLLLGGYVSIPDVDPEGTKALEGGKDDVGGVRAQVPAWKELLVAVAGPAMNIVLAAVLAVLLALIPSAQFGSAALDVVGVAAGSPAEEAGFREGDRIVTINGHDVSTRNEMAIEFALAKGRESEVEFLREGTNCTVRVTPRYEPMPSGVDMPILGVMLAATSGEMQQLPWMRTRNPFKQLYYDASSIFRVLQGLVTPKEAKATADNIGGPVMIAEGVYQSMRRSPWEGLGFLRFLNMNLAILNLLPIPVLDGGLIMFALFALVFRRRVPECVVKYSSLFFVVLLISAMVLLLYRDSIRSYKMHTYDPKAGNTNQVETVETNETSNTND